MDNILKELEKHYGKYRKEVKLNISADDAKQYNKAVLYMFQNKGGIAFDVWRNNVVLFNIS